MTPRRFVWLIGVSIISRILVFLVQLIGNLYLEDHNADAYRNRCHLRINNDIANFSQELSSWPAYKAIEGFTKWDAQYFLEISNDGYKSEQHLAFFPLFPIIIAIVRKLIFEQDIKGLSNHLVPTRQIISDDIPNDIELQNYMRSALIAFLLNNLLFFPIAVISLYSLTRLVKDADVNYAKRVVLWFAFNPASVFFSACYTESLFAALTFLSMFMIESTAHSYQPNGSPKPNSPYVPLNEKNRLINIGFSTLAPLSLSSATRSNGVTTSGLLVYQFILKYVSLVKLDRSSWSIKYYAFVVAEVTHDVLILFITICINTSGYILFQMYSYNKFCVHGYSTAKGQLVERPEWCENNLAHAYSHVQARYWNVGLFKYYEIKQLPNFLLASPMTLLVLSGSQTVYKNLSLRMKLNRKQLPYYVQSIVLTLFCGLCINVQVTTRLVASSCPIVYWICADTEKVSRFKRQLLIVYFLTFFVLGTILHTNYYPWT